MRVEDCFSLLGKTVYYIQSMDICQGVVDGLYSSDYGGMSFRFENGNDADEVFLTRKEAAKAYLKMLSDERNRSELSLVEDINKIEERRKKLHRMMNILNDELSKFEKGNIDEINQNVWGLKLGKGE